MPILKVLLVKFFQFMKQVNFKELIYRNNVYSSRKTKGKRKKYQPFVFSGIRKEENIQILLEDAVHHPFQFLYFLHSYHLYRIEQVSI